MAELTKKTHIQRLYQLSYDIHKIFEFHKIKYWLVHTSLLGAVRNNGIIPWEESLYFGIFKKNMRKVRRLRSTLDKCGYGMSPSGHKIFYKKSNIEFIQYIEQDEKVHTALKRSKADYFLSSQIGTLKKSKFGEHQLFCPSEPELYLDRMYSSKWSEFAVEIVGGGEHKLTEKDKKPAEPTHVSNKKCITDFCIVEIPKNTPLTYFKKLHKTCKRVDTCFNFEGINMGTYVINCDVHKERLKKFSDSADIAELKYCRQSCTKGNEFSPGLLCKMKEYGLLDKQADMTPIEIAIYISHLNCLTRILNNCEDYGLILEDDLELSPDFIQKVSTIMGMLKKNKILFNVLFLWNGNWAKTEGTFEKVLEGQTKELDIYKETELYNAGGVAYIVSKRFAKFLTKNAFPIKSPMDMRIGGYVNLGRHLTLKMKKVKNCYISPLLTMDCGGEYGTGQSTQNYEALTVNKYDCNLCEF